MSDDTGISKYYPYWVRDAEGNLDEELAREFDVERDALTERIEAAFADVPYPKKNRINLKYDPDNGYDPIEMRKAFEGKHWKQIPRDTLYEYCLGLYMFLPQAYRFFLPAFMIVVLLDYGERDDLPGEILCSFIGNGFYMYSHPERLEGFTDSQRVVMLEFLAFYYALMDEFDGVMKNLGAAIAYWEKYQHGDSR